MAALVCKGCKTTWHNACGNGWDGTCPNCRTDKRVEVLKMPKVPKGQIVVKVEEEEGGCGGEEEGCCEDCERRRDMEDVRGWRVCVQDEEDRRP